MQSRQSAVEKSYLAPPTPISRPALSGLEKTMEVTGGAALCRDVGLERLFRDVQGARYHPLQEKAQQKYASRVVLGLDIDG